MFTQRPRSASPVLRRVSSPWSSSDRTQIQKLVETELDDINKMRMKQSRYEIPSQKERERVIQSQRRTNSTDSHELYNLMRNSLDKHKSKIDTRKWNEKQLHIQALRVEEQQKSKPVLTYALESDTYKSFHKSPKKQ
jgi:hypothetical protein